MKFKDLTRLAEAMHAIIYPVFLLSHEKVPVGFGQSGRLANNRRRKALAEDRERSKRRMQTLASASGGRLFPAESIADLDSVFPLIEAELRSVYTLGNYPENQDLDGSWRTVEISVEKPGLTVRARPGYHAK